MDLFPDGAFVRQRSRARDKYVHADEDASGVFMRPLGASSSLNAVWKVDLRPVEGGGDLLLLQGAAYGRYLAVEKKDGQASSRHRGVRVVQRDYSSVDIDPSCAWTPDRVEAGQNYVRLHNGDELCLRAKGNLVLVTADARNGDEASMMQWRVEGIPSSPQTPDCCCVCGREGSAPLCRRCAVDLKTNLLDDAKNKLNECNQRCYYCLKCKKVFAEPHKEHKEKTVPLGRYKGHPVAWATGEETWSCIFDRIETSDRRAIKPYLLYKYHAEPRCKVCSDIVSEECLFGVLTFYCTLHCFVAGDEGQETSTEKAIVAMDYSGGVIGFCLTCASGIIGGEANNHRDHDWLRIRTSSDGLRPRLLIPADHPKQKSWSAIKKGPAAGEMLILDKESVRCNGKCGKRLVAGMSCSLQCSIDAELSFLPRSLHLLRSVQKRLGSAQGDN